MSTIYILWLRQLKRFFRSRTRIVASLAQPLLFLLALGYGLGPVFEKAGQGSYVQFLVPGVVGMSIIFSSMFSGMEIIWDRQFGFLKETLVAPVPRFTVMLGRTLGGATVAAFQGALIFVIALVIGFRPVSYALLPIAVLTMVLVALLFTALGTALAARLEDMTSFQLIMNFLIMPLFFLSGSLFPLTDLPAAVRALTIIDPLTYGVDALRGVLIGTSHYALLTDFTVLGVVTFVFLLVGSWSFSKIEV